jgi:hypothetical protein
MLLFRATQDSGRESPFWCIGEIYKRKKKVYLRCLTNMSQNTRESRRTARILLDDNVSASSRRRQQEKRGQRKTSIIVGKRCWNPVT